MRVYDIIKVQENGVIKISEDIATEVGIIKGAYLLVEADERSKELSFERIAVPGKDLAELTFVLKDKPGALADVAQELGNNDINILFNETDEIKNTNLSALITIVDMSKARISADELRSRFLHMDVVREVEIRKID
jgi:predicted amino acid-binding ACT domain protein